MASLVEVVESKLVSFTSDHVACWNGMPLFIHPCLLNFGNAKHVWLIL